MLFYGSFQDSQGPGCSFVRSMQAGVLGRTLGGSLVTRCVKMGCCVLTLVFAHFKHSVVQSIEGVWSDQIRSDQSLSRVRLFATPWIASSKWYTHMPFNSAILLLGINLKDILTKIQKHHMHKLFTTTLLVNAKDKKHTWSDHPQGTVE